jgi:hypothetical protein
MKANPAVIFVGKCLTLNKYPHRSKEIALEIQHPGFSWENAVYTASNQDVLTAWFLQIEKAGLSEGMPEELRAHLLEITNLNRERNLAIIKQANKIAALLNTIGIAPVFLKGTSHLLLGLYNDVAERMIGDIDFLVKDHEMLPAAELLKTLDFQPLAKYNEAIHSEMKHFPRMVNYDYPAAIEIHREVMNPPNEKHFRAELIFPLIQKIHGDFEMYAPGNRHLIIHNMVNAQINDNCFILAQILLRQSYDLFLLADRENPQNALDRFGKFSIQSAAWLATSSLVLGNPDNIPVKKTAALQLYLKWFVFMQKNRLFAWGYHTIQYFVWRLWRYISLPVRAIFNPVIRAGIVARLTDRSWYGAHIDSYIKHFKPTH